MTEKEKFDYLIEKGYYATEFGKVISHKGKSIGSVSKDGYFTINTTIDKKQYMIRSHRFIYYYFTKQVANLIDHINQIKTDNRLENLRNVSHQQNLFNTKAKGYYLKKRHKKWCARICIDGKQFFLGHFNTEEEARQAYLDAKKIYHIIY